LGEGLTTSPCKTSHVLKLEEQAKAQYQAVVPYKKKKKKKKKKTVQPGSRRF
jgi:hypothetical protein